MSTQYPNSVDTNSTLPKVVDGVSPIKANDVNQLQEAVIAVQTEVGTNPSSTFGTVKDRLTSIEASIAAVNTDAININVADLDGYFTVDNVEAALAELAAGTAVKIGNPEDSTYTDGLFTDFGVGTRLGVAIDRFNEVLKSLAPSPAPSLSDMSFTSGAGPAGNVSFGASNTIGGYTNVGTDGGGSALNINGLFTTGGTTALRQGIFDNSTVQSGVLADAVPVDSGAPTPAYPANAFGDADQGTLQLWVNGTNVHSTDLSTFGSGTSTTSGSGFVLSAATDGYFPNGDVFNLFKNRTGTWQVDPTHQRNGYNYMQVIHVVGATNNTTNFFEWVVDDNVTATSFASESLSTLSMTGSKYLSGVEYHTGGTASYGVTVSNLHRNTYSDSGSAISHGSSTNVTISSSALGTISTEADTEVVSKTATVSGTRILNGTLTGRTSVDRTIQSDLTSTGASISGILVDNQTDNATATNEPLNGEDYRVPSNRSLTDTTGFTSGGAGLWTSTNSLVSATAGYSDGLLIYNGQLFYPNDPSVANSGNFSTITNGPAGNVNYSAATGTRVYWRYFYFSSATSNFTLNISGNGTVVNAGSVSASTNQLSVEFLLPNTTVDGGATVEFKDANVAYTTDAAIGCYAATYGANVGSLAGANWGISFGSKNTSTSGNAVIIRITAGQGWTGDLSNISLVAA